MVTGNKHLDICGKTRLRFPIAFSAPRQDPWSRRALNKLLGDGNTYTSNFYTTGVQPEDFDLWLKKIDEMKFVDLPSSDYFLEAMLVVKEKWSLPKKIKPLYFSNAEDVKALFTAARDTNAGAPRMTKYKSDFLAHLHDAKAWRYHAKKLKPHQLISPPSLIMCKPGITDVSKGTRKWRDIWVSPASIRMNGQRYSIPLLEAYCKQPLKDRPLLLGDDDRKMLPEFLAHFAKHDAKSWYYKTDATSFNLSISAKLMKFAYNVLKSNIDFSHVGPDEEQVFANLRHYDIHTPFTLYDGRTFRKHNCVPSGSAFTLLVNSIVMDLVVTYAILKLTHQVDRTVKVTGDDAYFSIPKRYNVSLQSLSKVAATLGIVFNPSKMTMTDSLSQYEIHGFFLRTLVLEKDLDSLVKSYLCPKAFVPDVKRHFERVFGLHLLSVNHPSWTALVEWDITCNSKWLDAELEYIQNDYFFFVTVLGYSPNWVVRNREHAPLIFALRQPPI